MPLPLRLMPRWVPHHLLGGRHVCVTPGKARPVGHRIDPCGDGVGDGWGEQDSCRPLRPYFRLLQGDEGLDVRAPSQLSSVTLVRGDVEGECLGDPSRPQAPRPRGKPSSGSVVLGDTQGDCHGDVCGDAYGYEKLDS